MAPARAPGMPAASPLEPGATLVYEWAAYSDYGDGPVTPDVRFVACRIEGARGGIAIRCPDDTNSDTLFGSPWWGPGRSCYEWRSDGLWRVACEAEDETPSILVPADPGSGAVRKQVSALGRRVDAVCFEPPWQEEPGDDSGAHHCVSVELGPLWVASWFFGGFEEEARVRLVAVLPAGVEPSDGPLANRARNALQQWVQAQSKGDFDAYINSYERQWFVGTKRTRSKGPSTFDFAAWRRDRKGMFRGPLTVSGEEVQVFSTEHRATVLFTQDWASRRYRDRGPKSLELVDVDGALRIEREEMIFAFQVK